MITVYVRERCEEMGKYIGEFTPEQTIELVSLIKETSIYFPKSVESAKYLSSQFVSKDTYVYFEIIVEVLDTA